MSKKDDLKAYENGYQGNAFVKWLNELTVAGFDIHGLTCDLVETCGAEAWWDYFDDGVSPNDAIIDDMQYGN